jgi:hypothetical protein
MRVRARTQGMITYFIPRMDYVSEPASKWRGFILFLTKIGNNYMAIPPKMEMAYRYAAMMENMNTLMNSWRGVVQNRLSIRLNPTLSPPGPCWALCLEFRATGLQ